MKDNEEIKDKLVYIWNIFTIFGGMFSYSADEVHDLISQHVKQFDKYFLYEITKQNKTKVQCRRSILQLNKEELGAFGKDYVLFVKNNYSGFELPSWDEYLKDKRNYDDYANKLLLITNTFLR